MDLLVMENLFHNHDITKTYDLKGIGKSFSYDGCMYGLMSRKQEGCETYSSTCWDC